MRRSVGALGIAFLVGSLLACTSPEERFAEHVARGEQYVSEGETKKALLEYHSALKLHPEDPEINERVGDLLREQRSPQDAAFFYREAHRLDPSRTSAVLKEARTLLFTDPPRARQLVRQALRSNPDDPVTQRTLSELALAQRNLQQALAAAQKSVELDPEDSASWMQLGKVQLARVRRDRAAKRKPDPDYFEAALAAFARADEVEGGYVHARLEAARTHAAQGDHAKADQTYRDAVTLALEQDDFMTKVVAAEAAAEYAGAVKRTELERWALRQLVTVADGRLDAWNRLAVLATDEGAADAVYQEMLGKRADDPLAHISYANFLIRSGRGDEAISHLEEALEDGVESPLMWEQLLRMRLRRRMLADARATYVRMADAFPDDPITRRAEARLAMVTGRLEHSAEILRELVIADESFESQWLLARVEHRLGNLSRAAAAIDRALALSTTSSLGAWEEKARIHYDAREWKKVLGSQGEFVARGGQLDPRAELMRAVSLYELDRTEGARASLQRALSAPRVLPAAAIEYAQREGEHDPDGARAYLDKAFENQPTNRALLEELTAWDLRDGREQAALERLNGVIESNRVKPGILLLRADLLARAGRYDDAEADALRAFEARPASVEALDLLYRIYVAQGNTAEAVRSFQEAEEAGVLHAGARLLLGRLALHEGDVATARKMFEKVLEENPDMASAQSDLAFLLAQQGEDLDRALDLAKRAREELERNPSAAHRLGYVYLKSGRNEAAVIELRRASKLAEGRLETALTPPIYYHMGLALHALHRDDEALEAFETALAADAEFPEAADARRQIDGIRAAGGAPNAS